MLKNQILRLECDDSFYFLLLTSLFFEAFFFWTLFSSLSFFFLHDSMRYFAWAFLAVSVLCWWFRIPLYAILSIVLILFWTMFVSAFLHGLDFCAWTSDWLHLVNSLVFLCAFVRFSIMSSTCCNSWISTLLTSSFLWCGFFGTSLPFSVKGDYLEGFCVKAWSFWFFYLFLVNLN